MTFQLFQKILTFAGETLFIKPSIQSLISRLMEIRLAKFLSYLLHPLLLPTYATFLLLNLPLFLAYTLSTEAKIWLILLVFGFTYLLPVTVIVFLYYLKTIKSLELEDPKERTLPLLLTAICNYALLYLLRESGLPPYFLYFLYGALLVLVAGLLINLVYKISLHALGWGAAVASFIGIALKMQLDIPLIIIPIILLAGLAGYSRLKLDAHNQTQVYLGFVTGAGMILLLTFYL